MAEGPLEAALHYASLGWPVIPLHSLRDGGCSCAEPGCRSPGKHPRTRRGLLDATTDEAAIRTYWSETPDANVGIRTGKESGLVVLDIDPRHGGDVALEELERAYGKLPSTVEVATGGGGRQFYFQHPGYEVKTRHGLRPGLDLKGGGGYVVAPPSNHASGRQYRFARGLEAGVASLPEWLLRLAETRRESGDGLARALSANGKVPEGQRNTFLAREAGRLRRQGKDQAEIEAELLQLNATHCDPPLERDEVVRVARSISRYPAARTSGSSVRAEGPPQAVRLVELLDGDELFCSTEGEAYATVSCGDHRENWAVRSSGFRILLLDRYFTTFHAAPSAQALQAALGILEGRARSGGIVHPVCTRLAESAGTIYLDLGNSRWEAVAVDASGWRVVSDYPVKFRRSPGMRPLPTPERGGRLEELRRFIPSSDADWLLIATWLLSTLRPRGPFPILIVHGEQGSAKSTTARILRAMVDPATASLRTAPRDARDLMIAATNGWVLAIDNLSRLTPWLSDALCALSTGGGFATRALYTDGEEKIFDAQRPIILNGIEEVATSGDLLERAIVVYLPRIAETQRRTEAVLHQDFEAAQPRILGAALDIVVQGLRNLPSVRRDCLPRMADFALWGCAVAPALGWTPEEFLAAYSANRDTSNDIALENSIIAPVLVDIMETERLTWEGTASQLLELLNDKAKESTRKQRAWPKTAGDLAKSLRRLAPNLRTAGVGVEFLPRRRNQRLIRIESLSDLPSLPSPPSRPADSPGGSSESGAE